MGTVDLAPRGDWLGGIAADAVLDDVYGEVDLGEASPEARQAWMELLPRIDSELEASREVLLDSLRSRPGWAMHLASLGQVEYSLQARQQGELEPDRWRHPLSFAAGGAPGSDVVSIFRAATEIELAIAGRVGLGEPEKRTIERSFRDPAFLQAAFPATVALLGIDQALRIVPEEPRPLQRAFDHLAAGDDVRRAAAVWKRFEKAEWSARGSELREAERVATLGDRTRLARLVKSWASAHSPTDFGEKGSAQLVRLLQIWPLGDPGMWRRDPRTSMVAALLTNDLEIGGATGKAIWRAAIPLEGMPEPIRAIAMSASGMIEEAQRFALRSGSAGTLEWTPFWGAVAREWLRRGDRERAAFALKQIPPAARDACDVLLVRRGLAAEAELHAVETMIDRAREQSGSQSTSRGSLPLCLRENDRLLVADLHVTEPALLELLWDGIRYETIFVTTSGQLRIPIGNRRGRSIFALRAIDGETPSFSAVVR